MRKFSEQLETQSPNSSKIQQQQKPQTYPISNQEKNQIKSDLIQPQKKSFYNMKLQQRSKVDQNNPTIKDDIIQDIRNISDKKYGCMTDPRKIQYLSFNNDKLNFKLNFGGDSQDKNHPGTQSEKINKFRSKIGSNNSITYTVSKFGQQQPQKTSNLNDKFSNIQVANQNNTNTTMFTDNLQHEQLQQQQDQNYQSPQKMETENFSTPPTTAQKNRDHVELNTTPKKPMQNTNMLESLTPPKSKNQQILYMSTPTKDYENTPQKQQMEYTPPKKNNFTPLKNQDQTPPRKQKDFSHIYQQNSIDLSSRKAKKMINNYGNSVMKNNRLDSSSDSSSPPNTSSHKTKEHRSIFHEQYQQFQMNSNLQYESPKNNNSMNNSNGQNCQQQYQNNYNDDYKNFSQIGAGSFGLVFKCQDKISNQFYAMKKSRQLIRGSGSKKELLNEVLAMSKFTQMEGSENIVQYKNAWIESNYLYLVMELCQESLSQKRKQIKLFPESEIRKILKHISLGLKLIHKHNTAHLDIKPENILISNNNIYKIADLGLSRFKNLKKGEYLQEGDSRYLAKELLNPPKQGEILDMSKADIFSLGLSLYELMTQKTLECNGEEWHRIRNGKLDWDDPNLSNGDKTPTSAQHIDIENTPSNIDNNNQEEISSFQLSMMELAKNQSKQQPQQQDVNLINNSSKYKYSQELKDLVKKMMSKDSKDRPSAKQILDDNYMQGDKHLLRCEQNLNNKLKQEYQKLQAQYSQLQRQRKHSF